MVSGFRPSCMLKSNELLPIQEDIQMAETCADHLAAADVKKNKSGSVPIPSSFGTHPKYLANPINPNPNPNRRVLHGPAAPDYLYLLS